MKHRPRTFCWLAILAACILLTPLPGRAQGAWRDANWNWTTSSLNPNVNSRSSDHFQVFWGNADNPDPALNTDFNQVSEQLAQGNLQMLEIQWRILHDPPAEGGLGLNPPSRSLNPAFHDGFFYRAKLGMNQTGIWGGGAWGSVDERGFPIFGLPPSYLRFDPLSGATPHEYGHTVLIGAGGFNGTPYDGMWHEAGANWIQLQMSDDYPHAGNTVLNHACSLPHGRSYYDAWPLFEYLKDHPSYGAAFINKLWLEARGDQSRYNPPEYMFDAMARLDTSGAVDKQNQIKDILGETHAHSLTWDFQRGRFFRSQAALTTDWLNERYRRGVTELRRRSGSEPSGNRSAWYRVPWEDAPSQGGFDFIPIDLVGKTGGGYRVGVDFQPLWDGARGSDWRACLVAVNDAGEPRYSHLWNTGVNTISLSADENKLYLVVTATPHFMPFDGFTQPRLMDITLQPQAFEIAFVGTPARPYESPARPSAGLVKVANGGGYRSSTATVASTAWVGPNARVLGRARVQDNARIEDFAVVQDNAVVKDNAVVSGHALVKDNAQVYGYGKVRDWAMLAGNCQVYDHGRVLERACLQDAVRVRQNGTIKGYTVDYGSADISGYGIKDGDCANSANVDKQVLTAWVWGVDQGYADRRPDIGWRACEYTFETYSPVYAKDTFGITHGYLMGDSGRPATVDSGDATRGKALALNGEDQYVELRRDLCDFREATYSIFVKWNGGGANQMIWSLGGGAGQRMYLTPDDGSGKLRFAITVSGPAGEQALTAPAIPAGVWTHIAVTFGGGAMTLYINGTPVATQLGASLFPDSLMGSNTMDGGNDNYLGRGAVGGWFAGQMDNFAVYMRALNAPEVAALASAAGTISPPFATDNTPPSPNPPTFLQAPTALDESTIQMSSVRGTDASGVVEYYFACVSGPGHDSGWISSNRYTDCDLEPGVTCAYAVRLRDRNGNTTQASSPMTATTRADSGAPTPNPATFAVKPIGDSATSITMTATRGECSGRLVEYCFTNGAGVSSGWQSSPTWTATGLVPGSTHTFTVTMRNVRGVEGSASAPSEPTIAADHTPPAVWEVGEWVMRPYASIENSITMTARAISDSGGVEYSFECVSGGGPSSGWTTSNKFTTPPLADGAYTYRFQARQRNARANVTRYSQPWTAKITATTGYHNVALTDLASLPDHALVNFTGTVMRVNADNYVVRDLASGASIAVKPNAVRCETNPALAVKNVRVKGHLFTYQGARMVTYATVTSLGVPPGYTLSGRVTSGATGLGISGATVFLSDESNPSANPVATTTTDANGYYSKSVTNGTWYVAVTAPEYKPSAERSVVVSGAPVEGLDFTMALAAKVLGRVIRKSTGAPVAGATVAFSTSPNANINPAFTATTDAEGAYAQALPDGTWYASASATGYFASADRAFTMNDADITGVDFTLASSIRDVPRPDDLLFSAVTDSLPNSGPTGDWATYLPSGQKLAAMISPSVEWLNGAKWVKNARSQTTGYRLGTYSAPLAVNGATVVVALRPDRLAGYTDPWTSAVDIMYDRLVLGIHNGTGQVCVRRNGSNDRSATTIASGQPVVLSLVVQPDGRYKVWSNGTQIMNVTSASAMTSFVPGVVGPFARSINVGRNDPDPWPTFNGGIGDIFVYKVPLTDAERRFLEADIGARFGVGTGFHTITASAGENGAVNPSGRVSVPTGGSQTFTFTPFEGYGVADVRVDGVSVGRGSSYSFSGISENHSLYVTFGVPRFTAEDAASAIRAAAGLTALTPEEAARLNIATAGASASSVGIEDSVLIARQATGVDDNP